MSDPNTAEEKEEVEEEVDRDEEDKPYNTKAFAVSTNKALTSKFRGVCWNKKNKRWQAAINSNGRYLYLGSYDTQEEAARVFDKAAVRVRGIKARINYSVTDYVDAQGAVLPDALVESLLLTACNPTKQRRHRSKMGDAALSAVDSSGAGNDKASAEIALQALARFVGPTGQDARGKPLVTAPSLLASGQRARGQTINSGNLGSLLTSQQILPGAPLQTASSTPCQILQINPMGQPSNNPMLVVQQPGQQQLQSGSFQPQLLGLSGQTMRQISSQGQPSGSGQAPLNQQNFQGAASTSFGQIQSHLAPGATLDSVIMSEVPEIVGTLFREGGKFGAGIWNGHGVHNLGLYGSETDAKQACTAALGLFTKLKPQQPAEQIAVQENKLQQAPQVNHGNGSSINILHPQSGQANESTILHSSNWSLPHVGGSQFPLQNQAKQQQQGLVGLDMTGAGQSGNGQKYCLVNIDNVEVLSQQFLASNNMNLAVFPHLGNSANLGQANGNLEAASNQAGVSKAGLKLEPTLFMNTSNLTPGNTWQIHVSQPDPICNTSGLSSSTQEVKSDPAEAAVQCANPSGELLQGQHWAVQGSSLRQLANIDVSEALQLFIASKQTANTRVP